MNKIITNIVIIAVLITVTLLQAQASDMQLKKLDSFNIISADKIELSMDNSATKNIIVVKEDNTLYIDCKFFTDFFAMDFQKNGYPVNSVGTLKVDGNKETICLPLFKVLDSLKVRYTYSSLYGKEIVRIRTDGGFKIYKAANYTPSSNQVSHGNIPYDESTRNGSSTNNMTMNTSCSTGGGGVYGGGGGGGLPPGYGYVYPEGYKPGFYFGTYGFVQQGGGSIPQNQAPNQTGGTISNTIAPVTNIVNPILH
jgi:hypothetical protein